MEQKNQLRIKTMDKIHKDRRPDESYSEYLSQFRCEAGKEINVDAGAKEDYIYYNSANEIEGIDKTINNQNKSLKRQNNKHERYVKFSFLN